MFGVDTTGMGTYTSAIHSDRSIHGQGLIMTPDGEMVNWTGTEVGNSWLPARVSDRGMLFFRTASQNLAFLNNTCGTFEQDADSSGSTISKVSKWK
jgi:hypothetical protein